MDRNDTVGLKPYVMQNAKYQSCTYHLSSASRLTRAIKKPTTFTKNVEDFSGKIQQNGQFAEK